MPKQAPKQVAAQPASQPVAVEVVAPVTLQDSFDLTLTKLQGVKQRMQASDRELYRAVGEFATVTTATAQAAADLLQDMTAPVALTAAHPDNPPPPLRDRLQARQAILRQEADELLCTATTDADIDRALRLEHLLVHIKQRLSELEPPDPPIANLSQLTVKELRQLAKAKGLKVAAKATKQTLIQQIQATLP